MLYNVYQQRTPVRCGYTPERVPLYRQDIIYVGEVIAHSGSEAIDQARVNIMAFRIAPRSSLAAFPLVELA